VYDVKVDQTDGGSVMERRHQVMRSERRLRVFAFL